MRLLIDKNLGVKGIVLKGHKGTIFNVFANAGTNILQPIKEFYNVGPPIGYRFLFGNLPKTTDNNGNTLYPGRTNGLLAIQVINDLCICDFSNYLGG